MVSFKADGKAILIAFIGVIITLAMIFSIADQDSLITNELTATNVSVTFPAAVNTTLDLSGRDLVTATNVSNASGQQIHLAGGNIQEGWTSGGLRTVQLVLNDTAAGYVGQAGSVTYTYRPDGHVGTGAGNITVTQLIVIFSALAIVVFVIVMFVRDGTLGRFMRRGQ